MKFGVYEVRNSSKIPCEFQINRYIITISGINFNCYCNGFASSFFENYPMKVDDYTLVDDRARVRWTVKRPITLVE